MSKRRASSRSRPPTTCWPSFKAAWLWASGAQSLRADGFEVVGPFHDPGGQARSLGQEPLRFTRLFQATYGCPPRQWLIRHRIERAAERLVDGNPHIGSVAEQFGYPDLFLFSRQFRRVMGVSPRQWRDLPPGGRLTPAGRP